MTEGLQLSPGDGQGGGRRSSGGKGCWIALAVVGALLIIGLIGLGVVVWAVFQNEDVRRVTRVMGEGVRMMTEAQNAPGAQEVRALGCDQAMVLDTDRLLQLADEIGDGGPPSPSPDEPRRIVTCQKLSGGIAPSCDAVAQAYSSAQQVQPGDFAVVVQVTGQNRPLCSRRYGRGGQPLGAFDDAQAPQLPPPGQP